MTYNPYKKAIDLCKTEPDEVPYGEICSCNPKNGGSGICGCVMGNRMVKNPKKYNSSTFDYITTANTTNIELDLKDYEKEVEKRTAEEIVEKNRKINILSSLIEVVENDHLEFNEENTTGWDLLENAKNWLEELKNNK
jgi:hypothetical protein